MDIQEKIEKLRKEYTFTINRDILSTVNKH